MTGTRTNDDNSPARPWWAFGCGPHLTPRDLRNSRRLNLLMFAWMLVLLGSMLTLKHWGDALGAWQYPLAILPSLLFLGVILAFIKFVREADELTRKIHLESLAVGFGAGLWFMFSWAVLERVGLPELDVSDGIIAMALAYAINVVRLQRQFS